MTPLERAVVLLHFQSARAAPLITSLPAREQAMIARVDKRAFAADSERRARAVSVIVEELPVSVAVLGAPALFAFFDDAAFERVVSGDEGLVPAAARFLEPTAGDFARIEGAVAGARRRSAPPLAPGELVLATGVGVCVVSEGALDAYAVARASLGPAPHERVAYGSRVDAPPARAAREHVVVQGGALSRVSEALFDVLCAAEIAAPRGVVCDAARAHGAAVEEAGALVDDLVKDGLFRAR